MCRADCSQAGPTLVILWSEYISSAPASIFFLSLSPHRDRAGLTVNVPGLFRNVLALRVIFCSNSLCLFSKPAHTDPQASSGQYIAKSKRKYNAYRWHVRESLCDEFVSPTYV